MQQWPKVFLMSVIVMAGTALVIEGHPWWVLVAVAGWALVAQA